MSLLLVLTVLVSWGIAGIFDKQAVSAAPPRAVLVAAQLFNMPMCLLMFVAIKLIYVDYHLHPGLFFWEGLNAVSAMVAALAYFYAMSRAQASYIVGITAGYPVLGTLLAVPLLGEPFSFAGLGAAVLVSLGVAAIGFSNEKRQGAEQDSDKWKVIAAIIVSTVLWAALGVFEKRSLAYGRPFEAYTVLTFWKSLLALGLFLFMSRAYSSVLRGFSVWKFSWLSAVLVAVGNLAFIVGLSSSQAGYMIVMTAAYPLVMYIAAVVCLKETVSRTRFLGIALIVAGCVLSELCR
jgi:drug/metabolite transporter (DMT)-like permease